MGGGFKVAHSAPFFLFILRRLGFSIVALVSSNFLMTFHFCQSLFLSGSKAVVHKVHVVVLVI